MSQLPWLLSQPDNILSQHEVNKEFLRADYTMLHPHVSRDGVHARVIREEMTKKLDEHCTDIVEEISHALSLVWGDDTCEWKEVAVYDTMLDVIARISNRVLVGSTLCRDEGYLYRSKSFARNVVITAGLINLLPSLLRPLLSPFILAYDYYHYYRLSGAIIPVIKERSKGLRPGLDYKQPQRTEANDYISWALHDAYSHNDPLDRTPEMIAKRLTVLSFAAIQSSVITITNCLFDIASSGDCMTLQATLRREVEAVAPSTPEEGWNRKTLAQLHGIDSALRESMRLWGFISRGVMKKVLQPGGVFLPTGEHIPHGAKVGVTSYAVHHDADIYPQPFTYNALRFSGTATTTTTTAHDEGTVDKHTEQGRQNMVTSNDTFMAFSHGRHACPGRFFATNQLKLLLAAVVEGYEIEKVERRPENRWLNNTIGPPMWETLRVRRRQG